MNRPRATCKLNTLPSGVGAVSEHWDTRASKNQRPGPANRGSKVSLFDARTVGRGPCAEYTPPKPPQTPAHLQIRCTSCESAQHSPSPSQLATSRARWMMCVADRMLGRRVACIRRPSPGAFFLPLHRPKQRGGMHPLFRARRRVAQVFNLRCTAARRHLQPQPCLV